MKAILEIEVEPFSVPLSVFRISKPNVPGDMTPPKPTRFEYRLSELSDDTLEALCAEFRADVFVAAKRAVPTRISIR